VFGGHIFAGLSHLEVSAVGHLTAMFTAAAMIAIVARRKPSRQPSRKPSGPAQPTWPTKVPIR
jgi:membrane associated rhomboid family serine protease